jgi:hypothetical protein
VATLRALTTAAAPLMLEAFGVGIDIAAQMLITAGDKQRTSAQRSCLRQDLRGLSNPRRFGQTNGRHRLNRGGNRQANAALYRAVIVRMR